MLLKSKEAKINKLTQTHMKKNEIAFEWNGVIAPQPIAAVAKIIAENNELVKNYEKHGQKLKGLIIGDLTSTTDHRGNSQKLTQMATGLELDKNVYNDFYNSNNELVSSGTFKLRCGHMIGTDICGNTLKHDAANKRYTCSRGHVVTEDVYKGNKSKGILPHTHLINIVKQDTLVRSYAQKWDLEYNWVDCINPDKGVEIRLLKSHVIHLMKNFKTVELPSGKKDYGYEDLSDFVSAMVAKKFKVNIVSYTNGVRGEGKEINRLCDAFEYVFPVPYTTTIVKGKGTLINPTMTLAHIPGYSTPIDANIGMHTRLKFKTKANPTFKGTWDDSTRTYVGGAKDTWFDVAKTGSMTHYIPYSGNDLSEVIHTIEEYNLYNSVTIWIDEVPYMYEDIVDYITTSRQQEIRVLNGKDHFKQKYNEKLQARANIADMVQRELYHELLGVKYVDNADKIRKTVRNEDADTYVTTKYFDVSFNTDDIAKLHVSALSKFINKNKTVDVLEQMARRMSEHEFYGIPASVHITHKYNADDVAAYYGFIWFLSGGTLDIARRMKLLVLDEPAPITDDLIEEYCVDLKKLGLKTMLKYRKYWISPETQFGNEAYMSDLDYQTQE